MLIYKNKVKYEKINVLYLKYSRQLVDIVTLY